MNIPNPDHTGSASRIHSKPLANPAITKSAMDGFGGDSSTSHDASRGCWVALGLWYEVGIDKEALL